MDRSWTKSSQTREQKERLYPSIPNTDRYEVCVLNGSSAKKLDPIAAHRLETLQGNSQAEGCAARMKEQIRVLEEQKHELLSINERWAKEYRTMVQYYKDKLRNLKPLLPQESCHFTKDTSEMVNPVCKLNTLKDNSQAGCDDVLVKAQSEARQLQEQNRTLARRGQHQNAEIARLNKALEEALLTSSSQEMSSETLQDIWKHQADVYKEDFLKERKDREALKDKYLELEKKYKKVRNELHAIKSQATWETASQSQYKCTRTQPDTCPNENKLPNQCSNKLHQCYTFKDKL